MRPCGHLTIIYIHQYHFIVVMNPSHTAPTQINQYHFIVVMNPSHTAHTQINLLPFSSLLNIFFSYNLIIFLFKHHDNLFLKKINIIMWASN